MKQPAPGGKTSDNPPPSEDRRSYRKLAALLAGAGLFVLLVTGFLIYDFIHSNQTARRNYSNSIQELQQIGELEYHTQEARRVLLYAFATTDSSRQVEYADESRAADVEVARLLKEYRALAYSPEESAAAQQFTRHWAAYLDLRNELIATLLEGNPQLTAERDLRDGVAAFNRVRDDVRAMQKLSRAQAEELLSRTDASFRNSLARLLVTVGLMLVVGFAVVVVFRKTSHLRRVQASEAQLRQRVTERTQELTALNTSLQHEVKERQRSQQKLARTSGMLEVLLEGVHDRIYFKDLQSRFVRVSNGFKALFKVDSLQEIVGRTDFDFFAGEHARDSFADEQEILRTGQPVLNKLAQATLPDGRIEWVLTTKQLWRDEQGEAIGTFGITKNITPLKQAEMDLKSAHQRLMETSRMAGMAEVATGVLHNVGNVLNSVSVSATLVGDRLKQSKLVNLRRATTMLREKNGHVADFLTNDPKGKVLPEYLGTVAEQLAAEHSEMLAEVVSLGQNIEHIKEIVSMQQNYAKVSGAFEHLNATDLVEDALRMNAAAFDRHRVEVVRDYAHDLALVNVDRHKVLQILINLVRNAKYALDASHPTDKRLTIRVEASTDGMVTIRVRDNGTGIAPENLSRIFGHGFTTKKDGHGFGLHSGANAAKEMGGRLYAASAGLGQGAEFILELPVAKIERVSSV